MYNVLLMISVRTMRRCKFRDAFETSTRGMGNPESFAKARLSVLGNTTERRIRIVSWRQKKIGNGNFVRDMGEK